MICTQCCGKGNVNYVTFIGRPIDLTLGCWDTSSRWDARTRWEACTQCGGNGIIHCCEGECEQPEKKEVE